MSSNSGKEIKGYVTVRSFGSMTVPVPVQNLVLRNFAATQNARFLLSTNEHKFENCYMQLFTAVEEVKKSGHIAMCSSSMLPQTQDVFDEIVSKVIEKEITLHFVFENSHAASKQDFVDLLESRDLGSLIDTSRIQIPEIIKFVQNSEYK